MISLYGSLARAFEKKYNTPARNIPIKVASAVEMLQALDANFFEFRTLLKSGGAYKVTRGNSLAHGEGLEPIEIEMKFSQENWHIMPVAAGGGSSIGKVIFGAALIGASFFIPGTTWAIAGMEIKIKSAVFGLGASMALTGAAQMLAPSPAADYNASEKQDERPSYLLGSPVNAVEPGLTKPVAYGDVWCGSITVSGGMKVEDI